MEIGYIIQSTHTNSSCFKHLINHHFCFNINSIIFLVVIIEKLKHKQYVHFSRVCFLNVLKREPSFTASQTSTFDEVRQRDRVLIWNTTSQLKSLLHNAQANQNHCYKRANQSKSLLHNLKTNQNHCYIMYKFIKIIVTMCQ